MSSEHRWLQRYDWLSALLKTEAPWLWLCSVGDMQVQYIVTYLFYWFLMSAESTDHREDSSEMDFAHSNSWQSEGTVNLELKLKKNLQNIFTPCQVFYILKW
jgi:hypothetical protein